MRHDAQHVSAHHVLPTICLLTDPSLCRLAYAREEELKCKALETRSMPSADRAELGQRCPVLKTCAEIAQSQFTGSDPCRHPVLA